MRLHHLDRCHDFDLIQRGCRQAHHDAGVHRGAGRGLCRAGGGPRHHAHAVRLHHPDAAGGRGLRPQVDGRRLSQAWRRGDPHQLGHHKVSQAGQHGGAREGPGGAGQPLGRSGALVLGRQRRAAGDHARRRDAAHARGRHQRSRHQISRPQECRNSRHPRHRLAGGLAAHGGVRGARHQADPLLQPDARTPRNLRGADARDARRRGPSRRAAGRCHSRGRYRDVRVVEPRQHLLRAVGRDT